MTEVNEIAATARTPNLNKALSLLQGELPKVTKGNEGKITYEGKEGREGGSYKYKYADLGDVTAAVGPLLAKYGLAFHCAPTIDPADRRLMILAWSLLHESGEEKTGEWPLGLASQKPQSLGSAITYGRRYCLGAATGIVAEDDDDGQRSQHDHGSRQSAADAWESAKPAPPRQNGSDGNGQQQRGQVSRPAQPQAASPAAEEAPEDIDPDAQAFADEAHGAISLKEMEDIQRRAREAKKLLLFVRNPSSDGTGKPGKLAIYLDWKRKQVKETEDALKELSAVADETGFPVAELETHVRSVTGTDLESASAAQLRQAAQAMRVMQEPAA